MHHYGGKYSELLHSNLHVRPRRLAPLELLAIFRVSQSTTDLSPKRRAVAGQGITALLSVAFAVSPKYIRV